MAGAIVSGVIAPHTPRMGIEDRAPDFVKGLIAGERELGDYLRGLGTDLVVLISAHWVCTFNWYIAAHATHEGICVADEAPDLIPGIPYSRAGDPAFAEALVAKMNKAGVPCGANTAPAFAWDYASLVPMLYLDPDAELPVVLLPTCLSADLEECQNVGRLVAETAIDTGRKVAVIASCALSHAVRRGPELWPTKERQALDQELTALITSGRVTELIEWFPNYSRSAVAEMGGRVIATMLGSVASLAETGAQFHGRQFGPYAQSSGSGNASLALLPERAC